jgi:TolA-binding protein
MSSRLPALLASIMLTVALSAAVLAQESPPTAPTPDDLRTRVEALEKEVGELREIVAPIQKRQDAMKRQQEMQRCSRERRDAEKKVFSEAELTELDTLFKAATQQWNKPEGEAALAALAEKFPKADRTGAAYLQVGQMRKDEQGEAFLRLAAEKYPDACNLAGVRIAPVARFMLGMRLWNGNRKDEARTIFEDLRKNFADAVGPRGNLLVDAIPPDVPEKPAATE